MHKWALFLTLLFLPTLLFAETKEEKIGREVSEELMRTFGVVQKPEAKQKMEAILDYFLQLEHRNEPLKVIILNTPDVNALSLPGGYIMVNNGLLHFVDNDDELASVLAHELAHALHNHAIRAAKTGQRVSLQSSLWALALSLLSGKGEGVPYLLNAANAYTAGKMAGYTIGFEEEADRYASEMLNQSPFSAYGLVSFLKKLLVEERSHPQFPLGILKTHPSTDERVRSAQTLVQKNWAFTLLWEKEHFHIEKKKEDFWLYYQTEPMFPLKRSAGFPSPYERGLSYAALANELLAREFDFRNARLVFKKNAVAWVLARTEIFMTYPEELGEPWEKNAQKIFKKIQKLFLEAYLSKLR